MNIRIDPKIFELAPDFRRGLVIATNLQMADEVPELAEALAQAIAERQAMPVDLKTDPRIGAWEAVHRAFASNPNKFPPAHKALLKRVQRPGGRLPYINSAVAIMNLLSVRHVLPVGGDDVTRAAQYGETLELRRATGDERFSPLGPKEIVESPLADEVIYTVGAQVMCRRWNWRNGHLTGIGKDTKVLVRNTDGLGPDSEAHALTARDDAAELFARFCGATVETALLSPESPELALNLG